MKQFLQGLVLVAAVAVGFQATTQERWYYSGNSAIRPIPYVDELIETVPSGCRYLSEVDLINYYVDKATPFSLYSKYSRPLFEAKDSEGIQEFLEKEGICFSITLRSSYLEWISPEMPLVKFLNDDSYTFNADSKYYDDGRYYRWSLFRYPFRNTHRFAVLGKNATLVWHPANISSWSGKTVTISYLMRATMPGRFNAFVIDGQVVTLSEPHPGDGEWHWTSLSHLVSENPIDLEIGFGDGSDNGESQLIELANISIKLDGEDVADGMKKFQGWRLGQPLPENWFLRGKEASLFVSTLK